MDAGARVTIVNSSPRVMKTTPATRGPVTEMAAREKEKWVGTKAIVRDTQSGKLRKPTMKEAADMVKNLRQLTARPVVRTEVSAARTGVIEPGTMQVVVARAIEDGTMETVCVETFEEAIAFLGLVPQPAGGNQQ
jgi:hypothetical protein